MDGTGDALDLLLEQPERVRVGEHQARDVLVHELLEGRQVDQPARVARYLHRLVAGEGDRSRVRPVGRVGDDDLLPSVAVLRVERAHDQQPGQLPRGAGRRLEGAPRHAGQLAEGSFEPPHELERPLDRLLGLMRMQPLEPGYGTGCLRDLRVVRHGTRPQRIEPCVDAVIDL